LRLQEIQLFNFRKHKELVFAPSEEITVVYGPNGSGKTNILEAVHYCTLARGLNRSLDRECLNFDAGYFLITGNFTDDRGIELSVKVSYEKNVEKKIFINSDELKKYSQLIGRIPCVTFSPMELSLVNGSPQERRRFMDNALSQTNKCYLDDLLQYRRVLQQRNTLLGAVNEKGMGRESLEVWTEKLTQLACSIVSERFAFIERLFGYIEPVYEQLGLGEVPGFSYRSAAGKHANDMVPDELFSFMKQRFREIESQEIYRKQSLLGPHRDDLVFRFNDTDVKKYASQGQLRTFLIAVKLALHKLVSDTTGERPLFLLDDLFSELDGKRIEKILEQLEGAGQSIITATDRNDGSGVRSVSIEDLL